MDKYGEIFKYANEGWIDLKCICYGCGIEKENPTSYRPCPECELRSMGPGAKMIIKGKVTKYEDLI